MAEYISKEKAIKELREVYENEYPTASGDFDEYASHDVPNVLRNTPAEDVQPIRHGRWENEYLEDDDVWWADCTNCNNDTHSRFGRVSIYAYCPNCGARMIKDGEQNG